MKKLLIIFISFSFIGCSVLKTKKDIETSKVTRTETIKKADTLNYIVPKAVYKDTTIYVRNFEKEGSNTLKIVYDNQGNQEQIDCISDGVRELNEVIETMKDQSKEKDTQLEVPYGLIIIYVFIGLACLLVVNKIANKFL